MKKTRSGYYYSPRIFEKFALALVKELAKSENKKFFSEFQISEKRFRLDGFAPDGLDNIHEPLIIEIQEKLPSNYVSFAEQLIRITFNTPFLSNKVLFVTNELETINVDDPHVIIWNKKDIKKLSTKFPTVEFQFSDFKIPGLIKPPKTKELRENLVKKAVSKYESTEFNENKQDHLNNLISSFKDDNLVLFLGSGVSQGEGLPSWKELIELLIKDFLKTSHGKTIDSSDLSSAHGFKSFSYITLGRFIKKALKTDFYDKIKNILYGSYNHSVKSGSLVYEIAKICRPIRGKIGVYSIVSYNYDDILEFYLDEMNMEYEVIYKEYDTPSHNKLPVYHVHGYIPKKGKLSQSMKDSIVFAEEEYHFQYKEPYSWQNLVQLNLLKDKTVLFIGLSMTDPNLRRLLDISKDYSKDIKHYAFIKDEWKFENERLSNIFRSIEEGVFQELGINVIWYKDYAEINDILKQIHS